MLIVWLSSQVIYMEILDDLKKVKEASLILASAKENIKNEALKKIGKALIDNIDVILQENEIDVKNATQSHIKESMINRLKITRNSIIQIVKSIDDIILLNDPIGELVDEYIREDGLIIRKIRVPFGVICAIFESRPNVTIDISVLSIKTGNAVVLKGGSDAINTNKILVKIMKEAIKGLIPEESIMLVSDTTREVVLELIKQKDLIDLVVPRGSKTLIDFIVNNSKVPYIETGAGNCHLYIEKTANYGMALKIALNAKVQKPSVCNSIESILIDEEIACDFLPLLKCEFEKYDVKIYGDSKVERIIDCIRAKEEDYYLEYNDYKVSIMLVKNYQEAINKINKYSTHHSEAIISNNNEAIECFLNNVDSACLYVNASTRFTDGGCFGLGAELGISTQKLHARGPMGLKEMTTIKYKIYGNGQVRK